MASSSQWQSVLFVEAVIPPVSELTGQAEHAEGPMSGLKVPEEQAVHLSAAAAIVPKYPALQLQAVTAVAGVPAAVLESGGHCEHAAEPASFLYMLASHALQLDDGAVIAPL